METLGEWKTKSDCNKSLNSQEVKYSAPAAPINLSQEILASIKI
jgi:hypothetical protein